MVQVLSSWLRTAGGQLGRCPFCTHKAFLAMAAAWGLKAVAANFTASPGCSFFTEMIAFGLTLLWATHLVVFAGRTYAQPSVSGTSRRAVFPLFVKVLGDRLKPGGYVARR